MISPDDLELLYVTDDTERRSQHVLECYERRCAEMPTANGDAQTRE